jgi:hypothetical protein
MVKLKNKIRLFQMYLYSLSLTTFQPTYILKSAYLPSKV